MANFVFQVKADLTMSQLEKSDQNETRISHYEVNLMLVKLLLRKTFYTRAAKWNHRLLNIEKTKNQGPIYSTLKRHFYQP